MEPKKILSILIPMGMVFFLLATASMAQEKMVVVGIVKGIEGRMVMEIENEKDKSLMSFRIGRKTVYSPKRYPVPGERVKVEYMLHRGSLVAYTVTILGSEDSKESPKGKTK
ncbi:MAG: hypothetical protein N3G78_10190 [Desulfobacterota bacterium]|nr:hypothetical protein [Thermodesulfobacteriota bacterium]